MRYLAALFLSLVVLTISTTGQEPWIDRLPDLRVGCIAGEGDASKEFDVAKAVRTAAIDAGADRMGVPFALQMTSDQDAKIVKWEGCTVLPKDFQPKAGLATRTIHSSKAVFVFCNLQGADAEKSCADVLGELIKKKIPDFSVPIRVVPLLKDDAGPEQNLQARVLNTIVETPISLPPHLQTDVTPVDGTDKQLLGLDQGGRSLFTSGKLPPQKENDDQEQPVDGVVAFVPLTDEQAAILGIGAPKTTD